MPARPRAVPSPHRYSDHGMPKAKTAPVDDRYRPCLSPRSRSNLQHHPDGTPVDAGSARVSLTERSSRRHARSPGGSGGGRSDLCHDNDEPDAVNRRARVGDNVVDAAAELLAGDSGLLELVGGWLPSGDEELPTDLDKGSPSSATTGRAERPLPLPHRTTAGPGCAHSPRGERVRP